MNFCPIKRNAKQFSIEALRRPATASPAANSPACEDCKSDGMDHP